MYNDDLTDKLGRVIEFLDEDAWVENSIVIFDAGGKWFKYYDANGWGEWEEWMDPSYHYRLEEFEPGTVDRTLDFILSGEYEQATGPLAFEGLDDIY